MGRGLGVGWGEERGEGWDGGLGSILGEGAALARLSLESPLHPQYTFYPQYRYYRYPTARNLDYRNIQFLPRIPCTVLASGRSAPLGSYLF